MFKNVGDDINFENFKEIKVAESTCVNYEKKLVKLFSITFAEEFLRAYFQLGEIVKL